MTRQRIKDASPLTPAEKTKRYAESQAHAGLVLLRCWVKVETMAAIDAQAGQDDTRGEAVDRLIADRA